MEQYKVEKSVPLPERAGNPFKKGTSKFPVRHMKVGDSFFAPGYTPASIASGLYNAASRFLESQEEEKVTRKFVRRADTVNGVEGTRVWRIS